MPIPFAVELPPRLNKPLLVSTVVEPAVGSRRMCAVVTVPPGSGSDMHEFKLMLNGTGSVVSPSPLNREVGQSPSLTGSALTGRADRLHSAWVTEPLSARPKALGTPVNEALTSSFPDSSVC